VILAVQWQLIRFNGKNCWWGHLLAGKQGGPHRTGQVRHENAHARGRDERLIEVGPEAFLFHIWRIPALTAAVLSGRKRLTRKQSSQSTAFCGMAIAESIWIPNGILSIQQQPLVSNTCRLP
jgi:hypothetical protein